MTYAEEAFFIDIEDKDEIIEKVSNLSKLYQMIVLLPLDITYNETYYTNEAILIWDEEKIIYNYQKQHLIPFIEKDYYEEMDKVQVIDTKLGKITVAICYDINFPYYLNSLSREHFDILLIPSWDWDGIAEYHSNEVRYRAIEGGFNLIKNTFNGIVISNDVRGRTLSYSDGRNLKDYFVVNTVNRKGIITVYSYIGVFFNYLYLVAIICILLSEKVMECLKQKNKDSDARASKEELVHTYTEEEKSDN
jgi:apolipoprotein N-acyltransferase